MKICVLFPTETESAQFQTHEKWQLAGHQVSHIISGVGLTASAYATYKAILEQKQTG